MPFGKIEGNNIVRNAWNEFSDRTIGEIKEEDKETSVNYFISKFSDLQEKVKELQNRIAAAENKGSFYMQLKHLQMQLPEHDGLGDYPALNHLIQQEIQLIEDIIQKNRQKNTEIKNALLLELRDAVTLVSWQEAGEKVKDIRQRWIKTGQPTEEQHESLEGDFETITQDFYERRQAFYDDRARLAKHHEEEYLRLIAEAKQLNDLDEQTRSAKVKELSTAWKENGAVQAEIYQPLLKEFQHATRNRKPRISDPKQQLDAIEKLLNKDVLDYKEAKKIQQDLKNIRAKDDETRKLKQVAFHKIHLIIERGFVSQLVAKKYRNYLQMSDQEKIKAKTRLLRELIDRDKKELDLIAMNLENFNTRDPRTQKMMNQKLTIQKQKISIKEELLSELKS